jgi:hypothetical protein
MTDDPTETRTDVMIPVREVARIPMISAEQYQHVGRYAGAMVMTIFEQIGGATRMAAWADTNPTDFYTKIFPKMISRSQQVDVSGTLTIDDAISRLEGSTAPIDAEFREVQPQTYDL